MEKKVISRYAYFFKTSKSICLAYSSKNNSFLELSEDLYNFLDEKVKNNTIEIQNQLPEDIQIKLEQEGFICSESEDDDFVIKSQFITQSVQHNKSKLNLVIVPTLSCNFNCPYCFEKDKRASKMTNQTVDNLISFIKGFGDAKSLTLTWYGGEPLLAIPVIEKILNRITTEVSAKILKHSIITNGYLFDNKAIELFKKYPLDSIQITLDGIKDRHNSLRALKSNNAPTYDNILNNIDNIVNKLPNTELHIRVNIDKNNANDFFQIHNDIQGKYAGKNIIVYPGIIRLENEDMTNIVEPAFGRWETANMLYDLYSKGILKGDIYPTLRIAKTCCASCVSSYIIGPMGEIYKCWNDVSDKSKIIGYIDRPEIVNKTLYYRYHQGCAWYNDPICKKCFFMPICNGKCAWYNERNLYHNGKFNLCQCLQKAPGLLDKCLEYYYEHYK
ncbi:radical SAM protein [Phocaeicola coprocola]|uniref:radical SAM protein n=1 Tax=Phocaeicola coprocola TaxID=310298 RepID=UPI003A917775